MFNYLWIFLPIYYIVKLIIWLSIDKGRQDYRSTKEILIQWWKYIVINLLCLFICWTIVNEIGKNLIDDVASGELSSYYASNRFYFYIIIAQTPVIVTACIINQYIKRKSVNKAFNRYLDEKVEEHKKERENNSKDKI